MSNLLEPKCQQMLIYVDEMEDKEETNATKWVQYQKESLHKHYKDIISKGEWLTDRHVSIAQLIIKHSFRHIKSTLYQMRQLTNYDDVLQIVNINNNHWSLITTLGCVNSTVKIYDSLSGSIGSGTINIIASLFRFQTTTLTVKVMNVAR